MIPPTDQSPPAAADRAAWDLFVFRKHREPLSVSKLLRELREQLLALPRSPIDALVRAGEIESGLEDAGSPDAALALELSDVIAASALHGSTDFARIFCLLCRINGQQSVRCSHPEGFSYYGLNPLDFSELTLRLEPHLRPRVAIIGIRTVGSTLSAVVAAALRSRGHLVTRTTVRPQGEPYRRVARLNGEQTKWVRQELTVGAEFLIVDEGPGFSGSTFLSVGRKLIELGIPRSRILFLCSRPFQPGNHWPDQEEEWKSFRSCQAAYGRNIPAGANQYMGNGCWRELLYPDLTQWPACWTQLERIKHLSIDKRTLFKFEGFGRFGAQARTQAQLLSQAGLSPQLLKFENGYGCYTFLQARPLAQRDLNAQFLPRFAEYCAFRAEHFRAAACDTTSLMQMMHVNMELEFGLTNPIQKIPIVHPVYPDCHMQPHEWLLTKSGDVLKSDATGDGDGHQLPGPVDSAWDLAALMIEWNLPAEARLSLLHHYFLRTGDNPEPRISTYLLLYCVFAIARSRMAAAALHGQPDGERLRACYRQYRKQALKLLQS